MESTPACGKKISQADDASWLDGLRSKTLRSDSVDQAPQKSKMSKAARCIRTPGKSIPQAPDARASRALRRIALLKAGAASFQRTLQLPCSCTWLRARSRKFHARSPPGGSPRKAPAEASFRCAYSKLVKASQGIPRYPAVCGARLVAGVALTALLRELLAPRDPESTCAVSLSPIQRCHQLGCVPRFKGWISGALENDVQGACKFLQPFQ